MIFGHPEDLARGFLVPDRGVARSDSQVRGGDHHGERGLTEIVVADEPAAVVVILRDDHANSGGGPRDVSGAPPDGGQCAQLLPVSDDDEVPVLPVARRRRPPARLGDPVEVGVGNRIGPIGPDVAPSTDGVPGFHGQAPLLLAMSSVSVEILHELLATEHTCSPAPLGLPAGIDLWCDNDHGRPGRPASAPRRAALAAPPARSGAAGRRLAAGASNESVAENSGGYNSDTMTAGVHDGLSGHRPGGLYPAARGNAE